MFVCVCVYIYIYINLSFKGVNRCVRVLSVPVWFLFFKIAIYSQKTKRIRKTWGTHLVPFFLKNNDNNKKFQKQKPNRPLVFFKNCYCSLNLLFFVLPIIFITIKRKGNHVFFN